MLKLCGSTLLVAALALVTAPAALAQDVSVEPQPLEWLTGATIDWSTGGLLALFGVAGALFTVFTLVGGVVPGTAGQAQIEADTKRLEDWTQQLEKLIRDSEREAAKIEATNNAVSALRTALTRERWRQFLLAAVLYIALGGFVATTLAEDLLQAAAIGAGWTGIVGSLGLKRDYSKRGGTKDEAIEALQAQLSELAKTRSSVKKEDALPPELKQQAEMAKAL